MAMYNLQLVNPTEAKEKVISFKKRGYDFIKTYYGLTEDIFAAVIEQAAISNMELLRILLKKCLTPIILTLKLNL